MSSDTIQIADRTIEFKQIFETHFTALCLFANRFVNNEDLAKDLVQEVFIRIWKAKTHFISEKTIKTYLYLSTRNICLDHIKKEQKVQVTQLTDTLTDENSIQLELLREDTYTLLEEVIKQLPEQAGKIIWLNMNGLSNTDIAEELNISINTIKTHKKSAYKKIREIFGEPYLYLLLLALQEL